MCDDLERAAPEGTWSMSTPSIRETTCAGRSVDKTSATAGRCSQELPCVMEACVSGHAASDEGCAQQALPVAGPAQEKLQAALATIAKARSTRVKTDVARCRRTSLNVLQSLCCRLPWGRSS